MENLRPTILEASKRLVKLRASKVDINQDEKVIGLLEIIKDMLKYQLHTYLDDKTSEEAEKERREYVRFVIMYILPIVETKVKMKYREYGNLNNKKNKGDEIEKQKEDVKNLYMKYLELKDDYWAIASFRSLEHFAQYMEWDLDPSMRIMSQNIEQGNLKGYFFYANQAVLDFAWRNIFLEMPTGYGKDYTDTVTMAFMFGVDKDEDCMKVTGNPSNLAENSTKIIKYMLKPRYARVFPYYEKYNSERSEMFEVSQMGGISSPTRLLISGSNKGCSLFYTSKDRDIDGVRYKRFFFNDVTVSKDQDKIHKHEEDVAKYIKSWEPRKYNDWKITRFFKGTAYNLYDFLNEMKRKYGVERAIQSDKFKYTKVNHDTKSVFIAVPKLDFSQDSRGICTLPQQYSTEEARKKMQDDPKTFWAMDMQQPMPMEGMPFDYKNIQTYSAIPHKDKENECCLALLDPARTGANFIAMPIFVKIDGRYFLKDALFVMRPMEECINDVVELVVKHKITRLDIEKNTENSIKVLIDKLLEQRGVSYCNIQEFYSYKKKEDKIMENEASIRNNMVFPEFGLYAQGSQVGQFMKWFTGYSYRNSNKYDDAPDSVAMFNERFVAKNNIRYATVGTFRR